MATLYKCPNFGSCDKADQGEIISIATGVPATCPECGATLIPAKGTEPPNKKAAILGGIVLFLLIGFAAWYFIVKERSPTPVCNSSQFLDTATNTCKVKPLQCLPPEEYDSATQACKKSPLHAETLLRFHGSNTIGGKLLPALATAYLQQEGYTKVHKEDGVKEDESFIVGERNGQNDQIEIQAHGSKTAFEGLQSGLCDIGMSSRPIKPEERQALLPKLGDLTSAASEHVLALDGIALIVNPSNQVKTLSVGQVADIFSGTLTDWSQLGGRAGTITIYARDDKSGTYDFFKEVVFKSHGKTLAANAQRFEDSNKLSAGVSDDPAGIGFIGLNYIGSNKVVALSNTGVEARKPSLLTIKTEDYLLSRQLYLYTAEKPSNPNVFKFIEFAVGAAAQPVVASTGLVNLDVTPLLTPDPDDPRKQSARWKKLTAAAVEIPTHFRFHINSNELDNRGNRDIGRIVYLLTHSAYQGKEVILIGFADASGSPEHNRGLAQKRADIVKMALTEEGVMVRDAEGVGAEAFVAPNDTDENRQKNRRVEIWVK